jgi:hypothetical protein
MHLQNRTDSVVLDKTNLTVLHVVNKLLMMTHVGDPQLWTEKWNNTGQYL